MTVKKPKGDGKTGRKNNGQFKKGHKPLGSRADQPIVKMRAKLQAALQAAVSEVDIMDIVKTLVKKAKAGDVFASREVLDRVVGKSKQPVTGDITIVIRTH